VQCKLTYSWLDERGIEYDPVDLSKEPHHLEAIRELGYASAPVVIVNDNGDNTDEKHWYGFRPDLLEQFTTNKKAAA
jgi:glutaredoxin-like protein NrdH